MSKNSRPLSPHLQVYRLPMLAILSITHRITGVALSIGAIILPITLVSVAYGGDFYDFMVNHLSAWYGQVILFGFTFALNYQICNGIRHLFWDVGYGFDPKTADKTGIISVTITILLTLAVWAIAFFL